MYAVLRGGFNDHPQVFRTAWWAQARRAQEPVLLVERVEVSGPRLSAAELTAELLELRAVGATPNP